VTEGTFVPADVLARLRNRTWFEKFVVSYYFSESLNAGTQPTISQAALIEAYTRWLLDVRAAESGLSGILCGGPVEHLS
jgi:hypothetical protein